MTEKGEKAASLLQLLALLPSGKAEITVEGLRLASVDADAKTLEVEIGGLKEAGVRLSDLLKAESGTSSMLRGPGKITGTLSQLGWKVTLRADGEKMLAMGSGVSRLTGRISVNPLKLRKLRKALE